MTGYLNPDGSELVGGQLPSGAGQALQLDNSGNLKTTATLNPPAVQRVDAQSGDFVAGSIVDLATLLALAGTSGDANTVASFMGRLTKIRDLLGSTLTDDVIDRWARQMGQVDIARTLGAAISASNPLFVTQSQNGAVLSDTNPEVNISNIQQMILSGKGFSCSTGLITAAANQAASFFVPNTSAKNVLIWSVRVMYSNASQVSQFQYLSADDANITAGASCAGNVLNLKSGGPASASGFAMHSNSGVASVAGTALDEVLNAVNQSTELLSPGMFLLIPAGQAGGIAVYTGTTAAGKWTVTVRFCEY